MLIAPPRVHEATVPAAHPLLNNTVLAFTDCGEVLQYPKGVLQAGTRVPLKLKYPNRAHQYSPRLHRLWRGHRRVPSTAALRSVPSSSPSRNAHVAASRLAIDPMSARLTEAPVLLRIATADAILSAAAFCDRRWQRQWGGPRVVRPPCIPSACHPWAILLVPMGRFFDSSHWRRRRWRAPQLVPRSDELLYWIVAEATDSAASTVLGLSGPPPAAVAWDRVRVCACRAAQPHSILHGVAVRVCCRT